MLYLFKLNCIIYSQRTNNTKHLTMWLWISLYMFSSKRPVIHFRWRFDPCSENNLYVCFNTCPNNAKVQTNTHTHSKSTSYDVLCVRHLVWWKDMILCCAKTSLFRVYRCCSSLLCVESNILYVIISCRRFPFLFVVWWEGVALNAHYFFSSFDCSLGFVDSWEVYLCLIDGKLVADELNLFWIKNVVSMNILCGLTHRTIVSGQDPRCFHIVISFLVSCIKCVI